MALSATKPPTFKREKEEGMEPNNKMSAWVYIFKGNGDH